MIIRQETQRLILRKPKLSDWKDIVEACRNIEVSKRMGPIPYPYLKKHALGWVRKSIKNWGKTSYAFLIELKSEKKIIGCIDIHHINKINETAITGSWINKNYWKRGYITEAKVAANNFAFNHLKLRKLKSTVFTDNKASNKTQQSVGYKFEGLMKKETKSLATGKIHDVNLYGLLNGDWKRNLPKVKKRLNDKIKKLQKD